MGSSTTIAGPVGAFFMFVVAPAASRNGTRIIFGDPCADGCERIPRKVTPHSPPWEADDKREFLKQSGAPSESGDAASKHPWIPVWVKVGNQYEEEAPLPAIVFHWILTAIGQWNGHAVDLATGRIRSLESELPIDRAYLSQFVIRWNDRSIRASLGLEPNHFFSISIENDRSENGLGVKTAAAEIHPFLNPSAYSP